MRPGTLAALALAGLSISTTTQPRRYSYVGKKCITNPGGVSVVIGGATVATISDPDFTSGSSCTVIPPSGVAASIGLRCEVDGSGNSAIKANTGVALGVTAPGGVWCVEVRTVDPGFVE